jgi:hypothetical protein
MWNMGTKRRIWKTIRHVPKESNEEDIGPTKNQDESKINGEIDFLIKHAGTVRYIQVQIIKEVGHVVKMDKEKMVKRITVETNCSKKGW